MHNVSNIRVIAGCGSDEETHAPAVYTTSGNSGFVTRWRRHAVTCFVWRSFRIGGSFSAALLLLAVSPCNSNAVLWQTETQWTAQFSELGEVERALEDRIFTYQTMTKESRLKTRANIQRSEKFKLNRQANDLSYLRDDALTTCRVNAIGRATFPPSLDEKIE